MFKQSSGTRWIDGGLIEKAMMRGRLQMLPYMLLVFTGRLTRGHNLPWWIDATVTLAPFLLSWAVIEWWFRRHPLA